MIYTVGLDVGNSSIKAVLMSVDAAGNNKLIQCDLEKIRKRNIKDVIALVYERILSANGLRSEDIAYVASTGEGELVDFRKGHFYSMTCHARAALFLNPAVRTVVDVGALHAKAMLMDHRSKILSYRMTSQCASGSGQFLENIARYLGVSIEDIGELSMAAQKPEQVSGICAVLAETDVINMVSRKVSKGDILKGIHLSMARRLVNLIRMLNATGDVLVTGGLSRDAGLVATMQELVDAGKVPGAETLGLRFVTHEHSIYAGAIGAAIWAGFRHQRMAGSKKATLGEVSSNIGTVLLRNRSEFGEKPAFAERENGKYRFWSWKELTDDVLSFSAWLSEKGLKPGDRVALVAANSYRRLICELAVMGSGLVSVPIFAGYGKEMMGKLLKFSDVKLLITDCPDKIGTLESSALPPSVLALKDLQGILTGKGADAAAAQMKAVDQNALALIMFTSGTSTFPKGVQLTHHNILSQQKALQLLWKPEPGMRFLCYLPWHHSFGGLFERFFVIHSGGCLAIDDSLGKNVARQLENFAEIKPNVFFSVPKGYQEIVSLVLRSKEAEKSFFHPDLKFVFTAAAPLPLSISDVFKAKKIPVVEGWGLTETSPCCTLTSFDLDRVPGVVGVPIPGVEVKLGDENEILVKGPNVMTGYFKNHEETRKAFDEDGWFRTGDIGEQTATGLKISCRKDRMFKLSNGEKIFPNVIEERIQKKCKFVKHVFVFGRMLDRPMLLVFPNTELLAGSGNRALDQSSCRYPCSLDDLSKCLHACFKAINEETGAKFERASAALVIQEELSVERGDLTPSFKLVPRKIEERYGKHMRAFAEGRLADLPSEYCPINIG